MWDISPVRASLHKRLWDRLGPACYSAHQAPPRLLLTIPLILGMGQVGHWLGGEMVVWLGVLSSMLGPAYPQYPVQASSDVPSDSTLEG